MTAEISQIGRPVVGVGAVVWKDDAVLLVRRAAPPMAGQWSIPGGKLEYGEAAVAAAAREVREEAGVEIEICGLIDVVDAITRGENGLVDRHYLLVDYAARWIAGELVAGDDAAEARWVRADEIDQHVEWEATRRIIAQSRTLVGAG